MTSEHITSQPPAGPPSPELPPLIGRRRAFPIPGPILGLLVILLVFGVILRFNGQLYNFLSPRNIQGLLHECRVQTLVALGMLFIMITGGIDLSVGSVVALVTVVAMQSFRIAEARGCSPGVASLTAVGAGIAVGGLCGLVNGLVITGLRLSPFVATLGMLSVAKGLAVWLSGRTLVGFRHARPEWVTAFQTAEVDLPWLVSPGVWIALALAGFVAAVLHFTVFGRYCYAIGSNEATARLCGIEVGRTKVIVYTIAGLFTGLAGVLVFAQTSSGNPGAGAGLELEVIAAVVIGGASLSGGQGTVSGTLLGVFILAVLENGVSFCKVPVEVKHILIGIIVVVNTALSLRQQRNRE
jgi:ribose transport system permease protein